MIIGIGNDIIDIRRIEKTLERHGSRFTNRIFTEIEKKKSDRRAESAQRHMPSASPPRRPVPRPWARG